MNCVLLVVGVLFLPIGGLRLRALVCGASPMCRSEYYCCCLHYPPFHSLPLTEQGCSHGWATSTFVGFYCCGEEAIAIERALVALPKTGRWEPGLQMVRGSLGGRETTRGSKTQGFPRWLLSPLSSPRLRACFCSLSAPLPACELSCLLDMISGPALCWVARFGFTPQSLEVSCAPLWWADEESAGAHGRDEEVHFFHRSALDCLVFPALVIKGHWLSEIFLLTLYFLHFFLSLIPSCTSLVQGHLKEILFAGFIGDRRLSRRVWLFESSLCVCWQGCVVQEKGGARCQMFACWLHQENIKRPFMRCCKEDQVFWEHHQTPRVIPLFKTCPGDTFLSHLLPFLLFSFLKEKGVKKKKIKMCLGSILCAMSHCVILQKSTVLSLVLTEAMSKWENVFTQHAGLASDRMHASQMFIDVCLIAFFWFPENGFNSLQECVS